MSKELKIEQVKDLCLNLMGEERDYERYQLMVAECEMIKLEIEFRQCLDYSQADLYSKYKKARKNYYNMFMKNLEKE